MSTCSRDIAGGANPLPFFGAAWEKKTGDTRARLLLGATPHQPKGLIKGTHLVGDPAPRALPPQAPRAQGVRRTGPARGSERCGRLAATPGDAPVASTPPRRREPGR